MWLRFFLISALKWIVSFIVVGILLRYVMPSAWSGFQIAAPMWVVAFFLSFFFAEWALQKTLPGKHETIMLLAIWLIVGYTFHIVYAFFVFSNVLVIANSPDLHITYLFEAAGVVLAAYAVRRRKIKSTLGEGLSE